MTETEQDYTSGESTHKEESAFRIQSDAVDREKLKMYVADIIDLLDPAGHPKGAAINIVSSKVTHPSVNVHEFLRLRKTSRESYESKLPTGFHESINAWVKTMAYKDSQNKTAMKSVVNPNAIINRALPLLSSGDIDSLLSLLQNNQKW